MFSTKVRDTPANTAGKNKMIWFRSSVGETCRCTLVQHGATETVSTYLDEFVYSAIVCRLCQCKISVKYGSSVTTALQGKSCVVREYALKKRCHKANRSVALNCLSSKTIRNLPNHWVMWISVSLMTRTDLSSGIEINLVIVLVLFKFYFNGEICNRKERK